MTPEFELIDAVQHQLKYPDTFEIPDDISRNTIGIGSLAKLMFRFPVNRFPQVERMWVRVTSFTVEGYVGVLNNDPTNSEFISFGQEIHFEPRHVILIMLDPGPNPLTFALLRTMLGEWIDEEYKIEWLEHRETECFQGQIVPIADALRRRWLLRLEGLRSVASPVTARFENEILVCLAALGDCQPDEALFSWEAQSSTFEYSGYATRRRLVQFQKFSKSQS